LASSIGCQNFAKARAATEPGEPFHRGDVVESFVGDETAIQAGDADADAVDEAQRGELQQIERGVERKKPALMRIGEGGGLPVNVIAMPRDSSTRSSGPSLGSMQW
jgi:hypothetical protein